MNIRQYLNISNVCKCFYSPTNHLAKLKSTIDVEAAVQPEVQQSRQISFFVPPGSTSLEIIGTEKREWCEV